MNGLGALVKKEFKEQYRTHRILVVAMVFAIFGLAGPLLVKFLPLLMKVSGEAIPQLPPPEAIDALTNFSSMMVQVGIVVAVMVGMGAVANEVKHGTAVMTLSKPVSPAAFVTAKLVSVSATFLIALAVAAGLCFFCTTRLIGGVNTAAFLQFNLLFALHLLFSLALTLLFSCLFRSSLAAGGLAIGVVIGQSMLSGMPFIGEYLPGKLLGWGTNLLVGISQTHWASVGVTAVLVVLAIYLGQRSLKSKEI
jgi:ABC-2 type transport system permease protein